MTANGTPSGTQRFYFVDEAGDPVPFNRRKRVVVGTEGCSKFFVLGLLDVDAPDALASELAELRVRLLADPYFKGVRSVLPTARKTAVAFHAKDDIPEVRREVFSLLVRHPMRFFAVVRDKRRIVRLVQEHNQKQPAYRYNINHLYDRCVSRLFRDRLHKDDAYRLVFARRGRSDRTGAFRRALENARYNFRHKWGVASTAPIEVIASTPPEDPSLQAADYFLWALQRLFERGEGRYLDYVWSKVRLVHDVDDIHRYAYDEYYSQDNALTEAAIQKRSPGI